MPKAKPEPPIDMEAVRAEIAPMVKILGGPNEEAGRPSYLKYLVENDDYAYNMYMYKKLLDKSKWKVRYYVECLKQINVQPGDIKKLERGTKGDHWTYGTNVSHLTTEPYIRPEDEPMGEPRVWKPLQE